MPFDITVDPLERCVRISWQGRYAIEDVREYYRRIAALPQPERPWRFLHDGRGWQFDVPSSVIRAAALEPVAPAVMAGPRRVAIVVADDLGYGMMRVHCALREGPGVEMDVFRDMSAAQRWLGLGWSVRQPGEHETPGASRG